MKFFITGATGFIGSYLCHRLISEGHEITALVRSPLKAQKLIPAQPALREKITLIEGDLSVFRKKDFLIPESDVVIHLAGVIAAKNEKEYFEYNYQATVDFVECLERQQWRPKLFLYTSSIAAAGPSAGKIPLTEEMVASPIEPYGRAKLMSEEFLKKAPFPVTSFRPGIVLGAGDENSLTLFKIAKAGIGVKVAGLNQELSCIDVEDLVDAIVKMSGENSTLHNTYFVVHPEIVTIKTLWNALGLSLDKKIRLISIPGFFLFHVALFSTALSRILPFQNKIDMKMYRQMTQNAFICSSEKLQEKLDWKPRYNIYETAKRAAEGYKIMGKL